jgi:hypothetical protein
MEEYAAEMDRQVGGRAAAHTALRAALELAAHSSLEQVIVHSATWPTAVPPVPTPPRQERLRQQQLESLKAWQAKQEKEAAARPEAKRWIDPAIIDR